MMFEEIAVSSLKEHPQNKKYFKDIKTESSQHWKAFLTSVEKHGVIEPIVINQDTMEIINGNQRWKAAVKLGLDTIPAVLTKPEDDSEELQRLLASNVMRRARIDPFVMMAYIEMQREGYDSSTDPTSRKLREVEKPTRDNIEKETGASRKLITAADHFAQLPEEEQDKIRKDWLDEEITSESALVKEVKKMRRKLTLADKEKENYEKSVSDITTEIARLKKNKANNLDKIRKLTEDKRILNKEIKKTKLEYHVDVLEHDFDKLSEDSVTLASSISRFLKTFDKLVGKEANMTGIETHITNSKLSQLIHEIDRLQDRFDIRLLEEE